MQKIRKGVFETNSSSTHAIVVDVKSNYKDGLFNSNNPINVEGGEFGWEWDTFNDFHTKLDYMITMVQEDDFFERIQTLIERETDIKIEKNYGEDDWIYVDHADSSIFTSMSDDEILQYLFNEKSYVVTCNDNGDELPAGYQNAEKLSEQNGNEYKVYFKGN